MGVAFHAALIQGDLGRRRGRLVDWDRATTTAVLVLAFSGIIARALRRDPGGARGSAVARHRTSSSLVYFSVKWWNSLHQMQSTPETVSKAFHWPLRINAVAILLLMCGLIALRARIASLRLERQLQPPPEAA